MFIHRLTAWLTALHIVGVGPRRFCQWLTHFSDIQALFEASAATLEEAGLNERDIALLRQRFPHHIEADLRWAAYPDHHIITLEDPAYPALLREIADPPLVLYLWGDKTLLQDKQLGLVGSRHPSDIGLKTANEFAYSLALAGFTITSGLAIGIDGACHRGALRARGKTIAVSGTGMNHLYPRVHQALVEEIVAAGGAIISEFPLDTPPHAHNFPRRNRIISGLSLGVLVVEAALKSGSLITARFALEQNREVFAIPGSIHTPQAKGCHFLIRQGAKLVETVQDVLDEFRMNLPQNASFNQQVVERKEVLSEIQKKLLAYVESPVTSLDAIILQSGLTAAEVSSILLLLELHNYIQAVPGGYSRCENAS